MKTLIIIFIIFTFQFLFSQWEKTNWQSDPEIYIFNINDDIMIVSNIYDKVSFSYDAGLTWIYGNKDLPNNILVQVIFFKNENIFLGCSGSLYVSSDFGKSWEVNSNGLPDFVDFNSSVKINDKIFLGTNNGVYLSSDFGKSWFVKNNGIKRVSGTEDIKVFRIVNVGNNLFASTSTGIYISTDFGENWFQKNNGLKPNEYYYKFAVIEDNIYIGTKSSDIPVGSKQYLYFSSDMGETWIQKNNPPFERKYPYSFATRGNRFYIVAEGVLYLSTDVGNTWKELTIELPTKLQDGISFITFDKNYLYLSSGSEIYLTTDFGINWTIVKSSNNFGIVATMILNNNSVYVGTSPLKGMTTSQAGLFVSNDIGETWLPLGMEGYWVRDIKFVGDNIVIATGTNVFISTDSGLTWQKTSDLPDNFYAVLTTDGREYIFAASWRGVFYSSDMGINWERRTNGLSVYPDVKSIASSGNQIIAGLNSGVWISPDLGLNWYEKNNGLPEDDRDALFVGVSGNTIFMGTRDNLYRSTDKGESWELKKEGLPQYYLFVNSIAIYEDYIFLATGKGIYFSSNKGESWIPKNEGIVNIYGFFSSIVISGDYIFTGTNGAGFGTKGDKIYRAKITDLITDVDENRKNDEIYVYPNPVIDFLYFGKYVKSDKIEIISALGFIVMECKYQDKIDVSSLNSGLYFLKVENRITKFIKY